MSTNPFTKATRTTAKVKIYLAGLSGSGKTYSALQLAKGLGGTIAFIDTEGGAASSYADLPGMPEFDILVLNATTPEDYVSAIQSAVDAGYETVIIDSISDEWETLIAEADKFRDQMSAWRKLTPRHDAFGAAIRKAPVNIIATARAEYQRMNLARGGEKSVMNVGGIEGMKIKQRSGFEFPYSFGFFVGHGDHFATTMKDRGSLFGEGEILSPASGEKIRTWIATGADAAVQEKELTDAFAARIADASTDAELARIAEDIKAKRMSEDARKALGAAWIAKRDALKPAPAQETTEPAKPAPKTEAEWVEDFFAQISLADTKAQLDHVGAAIKAHGFSAEDRAKLVAAWKDRAAEIASGNQ